MGFYQSYVYLTDTGGTGFGTQFVPVRASGSRFRAGRAQHHVYCSGGRTYRNFLQGQPCSSIPCFGPRDCFRHYFSPLCHLHLAIGRNFHSSSTRNTATSTFSGVFGAGATEVAVRSQPMTIVAVTIFTIWSGMAFKIVLFLAGLQDRPAVLQGRPDRRHSSAPDILPHHHAPALPHVLDGHHRFGHSCSL